MNPAQLSAYFAAHKTAVLGGAAAAVAGLALYRKHQAASGTGTTAGATVPGTLPAAAIVGAQGPDSSGFDLYNAVQPEIDQILQQMQANQTGGTTGGGTTAAPTPIASTLFNPTRSGKYVRFADGQIDEVEKDGSLLWLNPSEARSVFGTGGWAGHVNQLTVKAPANVYTSGKNLVTKNTPAKK